MAHFAKLGVNNIVEDVVVVSNDIATSEQAGVDFLNNLYGLEDTWKQTSYNKTIRKHFAGIGMTYDSTRDAFIAPKPFNSWILDETTCIWKAPVAHPNDGENYIWNEENQAWDLFKE